MSFSRWAKDCDVYTFEPVHASGQIECCGCVLGVSEMRNVVLPPEEMLAHLGAHLVAGDRVPDRVLVAIALFALELDGDLGQCPYLARYESLPGHDPAATCGYGCSDEPQCVTCEPTGGWPSRLLA